MKKKKTTKKVVLTADLPKGKIKFTNTINSEKELMGPAVRASWDRWLATHR